MLDKRVPLRPRNTAPPHAALAVVNNTVVCKPVNCATIYGTLRPIFNPITRICVAQPSTAPSPSPGASPTNGSSIDNSIICIHGDIVCLASCTCRCAAGWVTAVDSASVFHLVYCNATSAESGGAGGVVGQGSSSTSCGNAVACFFVDELPYVLVSLCGESAAGLVVPNVRDWGRESLSNSFHDYQRLTNKPRLQAVLGLIVLASLVCLCIGVKCCCPQHTVLGLLQTCFCCRCFKDTESNHDRPHAGHAGGHNRNRHDSCDSKHTPRSGIGKRKLDLQ